MSLIPNYLLRRLYQRDSLSNVHGGVSFCLKNRLSEATITTIDSVKIDEREIPLRLVSFIPAAAGEMVAADEIEPDKGLFLPIGGILRVRLEMEPLGPGKHSLELDFNCRPFGRL